MQLGLYEDDTVKEFLNHLAPVRVVAVGDRLQLTLGLLVDLHLSRLVCSLVLYQEHHGQYRDKRGIYEPHRGLERVELVLLGLAILVYLLLRLRASILQALNTI